MSPDEQVHISGVSKRGFHHSSNNLAGQPVSPSSVCASVKLTAAVTVATAIAASLLKVRTPSIYKAYNEDQENC